MLNEKTGMIELTQEEIERLADPSRVLLDSEIVVLADPLRMMLGFTMTMKQWQVLRELAISVDGFLKAKKEGRVQSSDGNCEYSWTEKMKSVLPKVVHEFGADMATLDDTLFQDRNCYPDGLFEFDTSDRSAPDNNPPAMLRLRLREKDQMLGLVNELLAAIIDDQNGGRYDAKAVVVFSGKLTEVDE